MNLKILLVSILLLGIIGGCVFYYKNTSKPTSQEPQKLVEVTEDEKLELFDFSRFVAVENPTIVKTIYYQAGVVESGELKGYKRIIGIHEPHGPGKTIPFLFATKDNNTYYLEDKTPEISKQYSKESYRSPFYFLNQNKVKELKEFNTSHPQIIKLEKGFVLYKQDIPVKIEYITNKDSVSEFTAKLISEFPKENELKSPLKNLRIYKVKYESQSAYISQSATEAEKRAAETMDKYFDDKSDVYVVDNQGLVYEYSLITEDKLAEYNKANDVYTKKMIEADKIEVRNNKLAEELRKKGVKNPYENLEEIKWPEHTEDLNLQLTIKTLQTPIKTYNKYGNAFPASCGLDMSTYTMKNLNTRDLTKLGSMNGREYYKLKDAKHPLNDLAYFRKINWAPDLFASANDGKTPPSFLEYAEKTPLIFFQDNWGRWIALGEHDYKLGGGCGKPVVYLYPESETTVKVKINANIEFSNQIPYYSDEWLVSAKPNGLLEDLKSELTNCSKINSKIKGLEYAEEACEKNKYPYIFWSGNVVGNKYPEIKGGWIVENKNLKNFLEAKLTEANLTKKESTDMVEYWLPQMQAKNAPYYRISFLQNSELNNFIPMNIYPKPDTLIRIFLDYQELTTKPELEIKPQIINRVERKGFVAVEWGGKIR